MSRLRATIAGALALAATLGAPGGRLAAAAGPTVRVVRVDGDPVEGAFVRADAESIVLAGRDAPIPVATTREVRFAPDAPPRPLPPRTTGVRVVLRGGETIRGVLEGASADEVTVKPPDLAAIRLPLDTIRRIEAEAPDRARCDEPSRAHPPRSGSDVAWLRSGDSFAGTVAEAGEKTVALEGPAGKRTIPWTDLVVLHLDEPELPAAKGATAEVETVGGSTLLGETATGTADGFAITLRSGPKVVVPKEALVAVRYAGGAFDLVGSLPWTETREEFRPDPAEDDVKRTWWAARADRTRDGCPLRVAGVPWRHGIAVVAKSTLTIPLGKRYATFRAGFGIDDEVFEVRGRAKGANGDVTARVLVDGKEAWSSKGSVKGGEPARTVGPLDVTGASELVLEVGFGGQMNMLDRADWVEPLLLRAK